MINGRGRATGYNQIAPGRDVERIDTPENLAQRRRQGVVDSALTGGMPVGNQPFNGARQTIGAGSQPRAMDRLNAPSAVETGGITGAPAPSTQPPAPKTYEGWGQYAVEGLDPNKVAGGHDSPKYQIARIQSHFDPTKGVTQEMIDALNTLTYQGQKLGNFRFDPKATSQDWLYVDDGVGKFNGVKGADIIRDSGEHGAWQGWGGSWGLGPNGGFLPEAQQGAPMPMVLHSALAGNALGGQLNDPSFTERLRAQIMQALSNSGLGGLVK